MGIDELFEQLNKLRGSKTIIVGVGNVLKGDDGAGPLICRLLQQAQIGAHLIDAGTVPENYIQRIVKKTPQNLLIIDAMDFQAPSGTINIFQPHQLSSLIISTHTLSPNVFVEMIRHAIDVNVYFVGIQPAQTKLGQVPSPEINNAIQWLVKTLTTIFPHNESE